MKILIYGDNRLTFQCQPVKIITLEMHGIIQQMFDLMHENYGIGLSAPQVGIQERFFIIDLRNGQRYIFINPEIIESSKLITCNEGCLSFPDIFTETKRFKKIKVRALGLDGKEFILDAQDLLAQVIQHEIDHLNGILLVDTTIEKAEFQLKLLDLSL